LKHKFLFSVFIIFFIFVFIGLGTWQIIRLNWKNNLILEIENSLKNPPVELAQSNKENFLKIKTSGSIDFDKQIYLYNLNESGTPGFEVINPITIGDENFLINRGWIPFEKKGTQEINVFDQKNIIGTLKLQGRKNIFKPDNDLDENYWFSLNREDILKFTGKNFSEYIIYLDGNYQLPRPKKITANISNNHQKYAITWFSLALSILLLYLYFRKKNY
jgi:surfeit locus 1 family protein